MNRIKQALLLAAALGASAGVQAASTNTTMGVSFTALATCVVSANALSFGSGDPASIHAGQSTLTVNCSSGTPYNVALDAGQNFGASRRRMSNGSGAFVPYRLLKTPSGPEWGDAGFGNTLTAGSPALGTGSGAPQTLTVFGETIQAGTVAPGSYSDQVVVTVHF